MPPEPVRRSSSPWSRAAIIAVIVVLVVLAALVVALLVLKVVTPGGMLPTQLAARHGATPTHSTELRATLASFALPK